MNTKESSNKYVIIYLVIAFGVCWGIGIAYLFFGDFLAPITGELTLTNPVTIIALYAPSVGGLVAYYVLDGFNGVKRILLKLIPRKQDLIWFPILLCVCILFATTMHFGSLLFGFPVPEITRTVPQIIAKIFWNLIEETGLIGGFIGWIGFLLPYLQGKFKNNITSSLLTGFLFGLWVLPGYLVSSFETENTYPLYVIQLMLLILFESYIFNATNGSLIFYLFSFWLFATGAQIELYYFTAPVQVMEIVFFIIATAIIYFVFKKKEIEAPLQVFPEFIYS